MSDDAGAPKRPRGRPPVPEPASVSLTTWVTVEVADRVSRRSLQTGTSVSALLRHALSRSLWLPDESGE